MALIEDTLFGRIDKVAIAIDRLKTFEPPEGYYLAFSGGKDSQCIYHLAEMAGVKFDAHQNLTSVDPPELIKFVRKHYPMVILHRPERTMWQLIRQRKILPTRGVRYCCSELKERGGHERRVVTGIRNAESVQRSKRMMTEHCLKDRSKTYIHPIIDWEEEDVWEFIKSNNLSYCSLYDEGFKRIGCVMCPSSNQMLHLKRWPKIAQAYKRTISRVWETREPDEKFKTVDELWNWWITGKNLKDNPDQTVMFE
jgi:phosphoadenosine phosphosulfate reductase